MPSTEPMGELRGTAVTSPVLRSTLLMLFVLGGSTPGKAAKSISFVSAAALCGQCCRAISLQ